MSKSKIQWTDRVWNPIRGCSRVSRGCEHCYAERQAARFNAPGQPFDGFAVMTNSEPRWTGKVALIPGEKLDEPLHWKRPSRVFVNSMSDLFHEKLAPFDIARVLNIMGSVPRHTFQVLTKRPKQMKAIMDSYYAVIGGERPFPNLWLGVSVEDQKTADERIPLLLQTPAAVRFVSYEPAIGPVDFDKYLHCQDPGCINDTAHIRVDWLIYGGESGPGARPNDVEWARATVKACREVSVPVFVKQLGKAPFSDADHLGHKGEIRKRPDGFYRWLNDPKGGDPAEWPDDLRVREFPR